MRFGMQGLKIRRHGPMRAAKEDFYLTTGPDERKKKLNPVLLIVLRFCPRYSDRLGWTEEKDEDDVKITWKTASYFRIWEKWGMPLWRPFLSSQMLATQDQRFAANISTGTKIQNTPVDSALCIHTG